MVDGVLTSCYADVPHDLAHLTVTPMHQLTEVMGWIFGTDFGFPVYVGTVRQLGKMILPNGQYWHY